MDELLKFYINTDQSIPSNIDFIFGFIIALVSSLIICYSYKKTHSGYSFSNSYLLSIVLISLIVCLIMIIIGSNIARAFALIGAMSIVRFRNPVKETRDLVYIFATIAIGMSAGTGFYSTTIIFAILFTIVSIILKNISFFNKKDEFSIISVSLSLDKISEFESILQNNSTNFKLISQTNLNEDDKISEYTFEIELLNSNSLLNIQKDSNKRGFSNFKTIYGNAIINAWISK